MKKQYTWSSEEYAEHYNKDVHSSIKGCIKEAKECGIAIGATIYVGECTNFSVSIDSEQILEKLAEEAFQEFAEVAEDWGNELKFPKEDIEKLDKKLTQVINDFLVEHNAMPNFYQVHDIREVTVK